MSEPGTRLLAAARRLLRRRLIVRIFDNTARAAAAALAFCLSLGVLRQLELLDFSPLPLYPLLVAFALLPAALEALASLAPLLRPKRQREVLIRAERRLRLRELLSSAHQVLLRGARGPIARLLLEQADLSAESVQESVIFPIHFHPKCTVPLLLLLLVLTISLVKLPLGPLPWNRPDPEMAARGRELEDTARRLAARARREVLPETLRLSRELQELGRQLQSHRISSEQALPLLLRLAEQARRQDEELWERPLLPVVPRTGGVSLSQRLSPGGLPAPGALPEQEETAERLSGELADPPGPRRQERQPGSGNLGSDAAEQEARRQLDSRSLREAEELLRETAGSLASGRAPGAASEGSRSAAAEGQTAAGQGAPAGQGEGEPDTDGEGGTTARPSAEEAPSWSGRAGPQGLGSAPGSSPAEDEPGGEAHIPAPERGPGQHLPGSLGGGESVSALIRALPESARAQAPERQIFLDYLKQVERSIGKEDLPPQLRELVKEYFLKVAAWGETEEQP